MKRLLTVWSVALAIPILIIILLKIDFYYNKDRINIDGVNAELFSIFFRERTNYAINYSHKKFNNVQIGMTKEDVLSLIGEPISIRKPYRNSKHIDKWNYISFVYSKCIDGSHYRVREIYFLGDKVVDKLSYLYID